MKSKTYKILQAEYCNADRSALQCSACRILYVIDRVSLPDFFFLFLLGGFGVCTQPRQKFLCKKRANLRKAGSLLAREQGPLSRNLFYSSLVQERE